MPVAAYIGVRHVYMIHRLHVLKTHHFANGTLFDQAFHLDKIGSVAQHVTNRHDPASLLCHGKDVAALLFSLGHRLFKQHIVTHRQRLHAGQVMEIVGHGDDDRIGKFRPFEYILPGFEPVLFRDMMQFRISLVPDGYGLGNAHDLHLVGEIGGIPSVNIAAGAGAACDGRDRPPQRVFNRQVDILVVQRIFKTVLTRPGETFKSQCCCANG